MATLTQNSQPASQTSQFENLTIWQKLENAFERLSIKDGCESGESEPSSPPHASVNPQSGTPHESQPYHVEDVALDAKKPGIRGRASSMPPPTIRITPPSLEEDECLSS